MKSTWKKHYRRIPDTIYAKLSLLGPQIVVAAARKITAADIQAGKFAHLGLALNSEGQLVMLDRVLPDAGNGRYSQWNLNGRQIVRRDLPKVDKTFVFEVPNFGDWTKGTHDVYQTRKVYPRDFVAPKQLEISMHLLGTETLDTGTQFAVRFRVEAVMNASSPDLDAELFFCINLLQENVGAADIYRGDATDAEYTKTVSLSWDILPPGTKDDVLPKLLAKVGGGQKNDVEKKLIQRYELLKQFSPVAWISGKSGFQRYFGAQFHDNLVVFENLDYGNAIYVMYENWQQLSQLTRLDLLKAGSNGYVRIIHRYGWETQLAATITAGLERFAA